MVTSREELLFLARLAEQAERYDDSRKYMGEVALSPPLTLEERKLFTNAYKSITGKLRKAWRTICALEGREMSREASPVLHLIQRSKSTVLGQLDDLCRESLEKVEQHLLPSATTAESKVFYHKFKGDYQRYLAEFSSEEGRDELVQQSLESYKAAWELAVADLHETDPTRLGLALNFSVFYFELLHSPESACHLAKYAFDLAIEKMDDIPDGDAADSIQILQLLKDNLTMWLEQMEIFPVQPETEQTDGSN